MPVKIRLARHGRKARAYYHIVAADSRAPRDGKFIERLGNYNPNTNPATIELNFDRALHWLLNGAQPSDTVRAILSLKGVMMKKHLLEGVRKGAFDEEAAEQKFNEWMADKTSKIQANVDKIKAEQSSDSKNRLDAERKVNEERAKAFTEKNAALAKEAEDAAKAEAEAKEAEKAAKNAPVVEKKKEEVPVVEEKADDAPKTEAKKDDTPVVEAKKDDAPKAEAKKEEKAPKEEKKEEKKEDKKEE